MSTDEEGDDDATDRVPPLPPDDRLWRHPSEVSAFGQGRESPPVATVPPLRRRAPVWSVALVAGVAGAVLCTGVLALTGNLSVNAERVIERVKVTAIVPPPSLANDESVDALAKFLRQLGIHAAQPRTTRRVVALFFSILVTVTEPISSVLATCVPPQG